MDLINIFYIIVMTANVILALIIGNRMANKIRR